MSEYKTFQIFDSKANAFLKPIYEKTAGMAIRAFRAAIEQPDHAFNKHAEDFTLFETGTWNEDTGLHENAEHGHYSHGTALQHKSEMEDN